MKIPEYKATDKNLISLSNFIWKIVKPQLLKLHKHSKVKEMTKSTVATFKQRILKTHVLFQISRTFNEYKIQREVQGQ